MPKDWFEWHDLYQSETRLQQRLELVREYLARSLDALPFLALLIAPSPQLERPV